MKKPIKIKPKNEGKFTAFAKSQGRSVQAEASYILTHKKNFTTKRIKQANFAKNFGK